MRFILLLVALPSICANCWIVGNNVNKYQNNSGCTNNTNIYATSSTCSATCAPCGSGCTTGTLGPSPQTLTCQANGSFTGGTNCSVCKAISANSSNLQTSGCTASTTPGGSTCIATCNPNFATLNGRTQQTLTCVGTTLVPTVSQCQVAINSRATACLAYCDASMSHPNTIQNIICSNYSCTRQRSRSLLATNVLGEIICPCSIANANGSSCTAGTFGPNCLSQAACCAQCWNDVLCIGGTLTNCSCGVNTTQTCPTTRNCSSSKSSDKGLLGLLALLLLIPLILLLILLCFCCMKKKKKAKSGTTAHISTLDHNPPVPAPAMAPAFVEPPPMVFDAPPPQPEWCPPVLAYTTTPGGGSMHHEPPIHHDSAFGANTFVAQ